MLTFETINVLTICSSIRMILESTNIGIIEVRFEKGLWYQKLFVTTSREMVCCFVYSAVELLMTAESFLPQEFLPTQERNLYSK